MTGKARQRAAARWLVQHAPAWLALALVAVLLLTLTARPERKDIQDLSGIWTARVEGGPDLSLQLPGLFLRSSIAPGALVLARREVVAPKGPLALLVDRPQYAVIARWDGDIVGRIGDPEDTSGSRSGRAMFIPLPQSEPGSVHTLELEIRGDYGKGGILGRILIGPVDGIHDAASATEVQRLAFGLGLSMLAAMPLAVAARGSWRPAYLAYGAFALALAVQSLLQSNLAYDVLPDAQSVTRLLRLVTPMVPTAGVAYAALFATGQLSRVDRAFISSGLLLSVLALLAPAGWLYALELAGEVMFLTSAFLFVAHVLRCVRAALPGGMLFAAAVLPILWALASEITLTHGLRTGQADILLPGLLFTTLLGAALVLRDAEAGERHERLVQGSIDAMVTVDRDGILRDVNPAAHQLLAPLVQRAAIASLVLPEDRATVKAHLKRALNSPDRIEFRSQGRVLESLATPLGKELTMLTLRDITVRRELDNGLLQAARMETMALLLSGIAHDFNNMLSTLLAHLGLLRTQNGGDAPEVRSARLARIERMEGTIDRASELTRRLLTVARGTGSELEAIDLGEVIRGALDLVEPGWPQGIDLVRDIPDPLPPVLGAKGDLEQVLVNLLVNAKDAVSEGGHIRIAARPFRHGDRGRGVALLVEDDGPGVPETRVEEVFQPFVTTKPRGTGLGLAVARQILRDHHGRIWVERAPSGGARFLVALRQVQGDIEAPAPNTTRDGWPLN